MLRLHCAGGNGFNTVAGSVLFLAASGSETSGCGSATATGFGLASESIVVELPGTVNSGARFCDEAAGKVDEATGVCAIAGSVANNNKTNAKEAPNLDNTPLWSNIIWFPYLIREAVSIGLRS
jgi:hypothetical protein